MASCCVWSSTQTRRSDSTDSLTSRGISRLIENDDPFPGAYTLEVTSPDSNGNFAGRTPSRRLTSDVHIKTFRKIEDDKHHRGVLVAADADAIVVVTFIGTDGRIQTQ